MSPPSAHNRVLPQETIEDIFQVLRSAPSSSARPASASDPRLPLALASRRLSEIGTPLLWKELPTITRFKFIAPQLPSGAPSDQRARIQLLCLKVQSYTETFRPIGGNRDGAYDAPHAIAVSDFEGLLSSLVSACARASEPLFRALLKLEICLTDHPDTILDKLLAQCLLASLKSLNLSSDNKYYSGAAFGALLRRAQAAATVGSYRTDFASLQTLAIPSLLRAVIATVGPLPKVCKLLLHRQIDRLLPGDLGHRTLDKLEFLTASDADIDLHTGDSRVGDLLRALPAPHRLDTVELIVSTRTWRAAFTAANEQLSADSLRRLCIEVHAQSGAHEPLKAFDNMRTFAALTCFELLFGATPRGFAATFGARDLCTLVAHLPSLDTLMIYVGDRPDEIAFFLTLEELVRLGEAFARHPTRSAPLELHLPLSAAQVPEVGEDYVFNRDVQIHLPTRALPISSALAVANFFICIADVLTLAFYDSGEVPAGGRFPERVSKWNEVASSL
ncbi:hypothetical protein HDZ31DRAFT_63816 [Schizophyllum fasciatum]